MLIEKDSPLQRFQVVAQIIWRHLNLPPLTPIQKEMCDWLQYGPKRLQMWAFRGAGKSYLTSGYVVYRLLINPEEKILVISASKDRADAFVQFTRRLIEEIPLFHHLRPRRDLRYRDSTVSFDVGCCVPAHSPSVKALGITGQLSGSRASTIILDDVEVPNNSDTPAQREKLAEAIKEIDAILLPESEELRVDPRVRVLGTPQSMETIYSILEERGYEPRIWPILTPNKSTLLGYRGHMAPSIEAIRAQAVRDTKDPEGIPTEPTRFSLVDVQERKVSYGALGFALQFMLSTALSDAEKYPLKCRDAMFAAFTPTKVREVYVHSNNQKFRLKDIDCPGIQGDGFYNPADEIGDWVQPDCTVVAVDPSGRGKDETAVISGSAKNGFCFVHRVAGFLSGYEEPTLVAIAEEAKRVKANKIVVEANYGDGMLTRLLQPIVNRIYPCAIEEIKNSIRKERRIIDTLAPVLEGHRLVFHESIPASDTIAHDSDSDFRARDRRLFYQMTHLTDEKGCLAHDDRLDCLALLVASFSQFMAIDAHSERRAREEQQYKEMMGYNPYTTHTAGPVWEDPLSIGGMSLVDSML